MLAAEISRRLFFCLQLVQIPTVLWYCTEVLLRDVRPISESSLADLIGSPRTTVRAHVKCLIDNGLAVRSEGGVALSEKGANLLNQFSKETLSIVLGDRQGYSPVLLELIFLALRKERPKAARKTLESLIFRPSIRL